MTNQPNSDTVVLSWSQEPVSRQFQMPGFKQRVEKIWEATRDNNTEIAEAVLRSCSFVEDQLALMNERDLRDFSSLIHLAASKGNTRLLQLFFDCGANVNARTGTFDTPLHLAMANKQIQAVRWLMLHGAQVDALNMDGKSPAEMIPTEEKTQPMAIACLHLIDRSQKKRFDKSQLMSFKRSN
eukprot:c3568_g1_i1.p1 GENE.c3568_g1_i1~~c3568_g1_i1.p1  ORF type:complete len:201 (+),score=28.79 c3568_g1_i1:56-604(+)